MKPEERARVKIDKQLNNAGWEIVSRNEYVPNSTLVVKEAIMRGNIESDYLLFIEDKAIAVVEAKKEDNPLGENVKKQAEDYAVNPQPWYGFCGLTILFLLSIWRMVIKFITKICLCQIVSMKN